MSWEPEVKELQLRRQKSLQLGGEERVARHHQAGKLTVRERIDALLEKDSFQEIGQLSGDATWEDGRFKDIIPDMTASCARPIMTTKPRSAACGARVKSNGGAASSS